MGRSIFSMGFRSDPFMGQLPGMISMPPVLPVLNLTYDQIRAQNWKPLRDLRLPPGVVSVYPVVVKLQNNEGEFLIYADGSAQYTNYGTGNVSAPFRIK
jgi:hypothetical protein